MYVRVHKLRVFLKNLNLCLKLKHDNIWTERLDSTDATATGAQTDWTVGGDISGDILLGSRTHTGFLW